MPTHQQCSLRTAYYNIRNTCGDTERNNVTTRKKKLLVPLGNTLIRSTLIIRT